MFEVVGTSEKIEVPEEGDVYTSGSGEHIGTLDTSSFGAVKQALHLQIMVNGEWYIYQLVGIEKLGEENAQSVER